jgi:hypothetical protein
MQAITVDKNNNIVTAGYRNGDTFNRYLAYSKFRTTGYNGSDIGATSRPFANIYAGNYRGRELRVANFDVAEEYEVLDESIGPGDVVRFVKDNDGNELLVERAVSNCSSSAAGSSTTENDLGNSQLGFFGPLTPTAKAQPVIEDDYSTPEGEAQYLDGFGQDDCTYDNSVVGVISTEPGLYLKDWEKNKSNGRPVALVGRVPVKVTLENGPIERGDYLVASSTPGYAMKATKGGMIVGRAMEDFNPEKNNLIGNSLVNGGDSESVKLHMQEVEKEIEDVLEVVTNSAERENDGKVKLATDKDGEEQEKPVEQVEKEVQELKSHITQTEDNYKNQSADNGNSEEIASGRIMMYVDLNYISDEVFEEREKTIGAINVSDLILDNGNNLFDIVNDSGRKKLVSAGDIEIGGTLAANVITTADIEDLTVKLNENTALNVINQENDTVFTIDDGGKITLSSAEGSSKGVVTVESELDQLKVKNEAITSESKVFLTMQDTDIEGGVKDIESGEFTIKLSRPADRDIEIDYIIIN